MQHVKTGLAAAVILAGFAIFGARPAATAENDPSVNGPPIAFRADLSPNEEVPPTDSKGTGTAEFVLNRSDLKLTWKVTFKDLSGPVTAAHIHAPERPAGKAPMIIDLASHGLKSPLEGSVNLDEIQLLYFLNGRVYVNIHTAKYKDGEIRGQIERLATAPSVNK
jgi:hypothetical protein